MIACGVNIGCGELLLRLLAIGLSNGAVLALNAIGVTLVYGVVRAVNFAHGDLFALGTALTAWGVILLALTPGAGAPTVVGALLILGAAMAGGALVNVGVERLAFRPFRGRSRVAPLIATIGLSFVLYQAALLLRYATNAVIPGEHRSVPWQDELPRFRIPDLLPGLDLAAALGLRTTLAYPLKDALVPLAAAALAGVVGLFLTRTRTGRALRAAAQDPQMARLCGVDPDAAVRLAFALGGALAGAAAFAYALYYTHPYTLYGAQSGLFALTAAVLGGVGRPRGAFWSGLLLGVVAAFSDYFLAAQWTPVVILSILMLILALRPGGLVAADIGEEEGGRQEPGPRRQEPGGGRVSPGARPRASAVRALRALRGSALLIWAPIALLALAVPLLGSGGDLTLLRMLIFVLLALGLTVVLGFAGLLDLGYAAFFAVGAYVAGVVTERGGALAWLFGERPEFLVVLAAAAGVAALLGLANALVTLRLREEALAIVTLAFGQLVPQLVLNLGEWTGAARGLAGLPAPRILGQPLAAPAHRVYLALALVAIAALACRRLQVSRIGRAWRAMREDETAAAYAGVTVGRARGLAFVIGAAVAGAAGALFAASFSYVDPAQSELRISAMVLAMVVIGGAGSIPGAILGALGVAAYDQLVIPLVGMWADHASSLPGLAWLAVFDVRSLNFLSFGLALYLAALLRFGRR